MKMKTNFRFYLLTTLTLGLAALSAQPARQHVASFFEFLAPETGSTLVLSTDISALMAEKNRNDYQAGTLTAANGKSFSVEVRPRGKYRRKIAQIPPLKIKAKKKLLLDEGLDTLNEVKLVLPCYLDGKGDDLVIREYLIYRMFELISPASVRARLIDLKLVNTGAGNAPQYTVKAILLEDEEETTARLQGQQLETYGFTMDSLQTDQAALTAMFQCMIGNTDWNIAEQRNVRFIRIPSGEVLLVPFDFDFAGFVNAPYATPMAGLGLRSVQERYLMAQGLKPEALERAYRILQGQRESFSQLCNAPYVPAATANKLNDYLDSFFRKADKQGTSFFR